MGLKQDDSTLLLPLRPAYLLCWATRSVTSDWCHQDHLQTRRDYMQGTCASCSHQRTRLKVCVMPLPLLSLPNNQCISFNNLTLKYVDASFYQVARGLVLPITVGFSSLLLHARPSLRILVSCAIVTAGFFVGVLIDTPSTAYWGKAAAAVASAGTTAAPKIAAKTPSLIGVAFGVLSSVSTALHAVVIKRSLDAVGGSTLQLAWYSNLLSALVMVPIFILGGEVPSVMSLLFGVSGSSPDEGINALQTFLWGSTITVRRCISCQVCFLTQ